MAYSLITPSYPNTGLSAKREGNKITFSWKIREKDLEAQFVKVRIKGAKKWGGWSTEKKLGKKKTSYTYTVDLIAHPNVTAVQFAVRTTAVHRHYASPWASYTYTVTTPARPSIAVDRPQTNVTTFTITTQSDPTAHAWYTGFEYRTRYVESTGTDTGWGAWTRGSSTTLTYTDTTSGKYRQVQVRAIGPAGHSKEASAVRFVGQPQVATWEDVVCQKMSSYYKMTYSVNVTGNANRLDEIVPQYVITTPDANMDPPDGGWTDGTSFGYKAAGTYELFINTDELVGLDECLWGRIKTIHDGVSNNSDSRLIVTGRLTPPDADIEVQNIRASGFSVAVSNLDKGTDVPGTYVEVYLERASNPGLENYTLIGTLTASGTISCTEDITEETGYGIHLRNVTADGVSMTSDFFDYMTTMPQAPTLLSVTPTSNPGKVLVEWQHNWRSANGSVLAWTDDPDAWTSNDDPEEYEISDTTNSWFIMGLATDKTWYFRVRSTYTIGDAMTRSPWSADMAVELTETPISPALFLSDEAITADGTVTAYWATVGTKEQTAAAVWQGTLGNDGVFVPDHEIVAVTDALTVEISAEDHGWADGTAVWLALQTQTASGISEFSAPVKLTITEPPTITVESTSLEASMTVTEYFDGDGSTSSFPLAYGTTSASATINGSAVSASVVGGNVILASIPPIGAEIVVTYDTTDYNVLAEMPLEWTGTVENAKDWSVTITRAESYPMTRPDGKTTTGAQGEAIYIGQGQSIERSDLIGTLDDGAFYYLTIEAVNEYGQRAQWQTQFIVHWSHQAWIPSGTVTIDGLVAHITPAQASGYAQGDTCDIYRLSKDDPELIYTGAEFGQEYVDPFPAFGEQSGYKIVTVTVDGDFITDGNEFAEYEPDYDKLDPGELVIDCNGVQIGLPYNITLDSGWEKDFKRTAHLGGHVTGDYNKPVTRDITVNTVLVRNIEEESVATMHYLATHAGKMHVRTPDGSSVLANVSVQESRGYDTALVTYSLTIQKVDPEGYDAMTIEEWEALQ